MPSLKSRDQDHPTLHGILRAGKGWHDFATQQANQPGEVFKHPPRFRKKRPRRKSQAKLPQACLPFFWTFKMTKRTPPFVGSCLADHSEESMFRLAGLRRRQGAVIGTWPFDGALREPCGEKRALSVSVSLCHFGFVSNWSNPGPKRLVFFGSPTATHIRGWAGQF